MKKKHFWLQKISLEDKTKVKVKSKVVFNPGDSETENSELKGPDKLKYLNIMWMKQDESIGQDRLMKGPTPSPSSKSRPRSVWTSGDSKRCSRPSARCSHDIRKCVRDHKGLKRLSSFRMSCFPLERLFIRREPLPLPVEALRRDPAVCFRPKPLLCRASGSTCL